SRPTSTGRPTTPRPARSTGRARSPRRSAASAASAGRPAHRPTARAAARARPTGRPWTRRPGRRSRTPAAPAATGRVPACPGARTWRSAAGSSASGRRCADRRGQAPVLHPTSAAATVAGVVARRRRRGELTGPVGEVALAVVAALVGVAVVGPVIGYAVLWWRGWQVVLPLLLGGVPPARALGLPPVRCRRCGAPLGLGALPVLPATVRRWRCRSCGERLAAAHGAVELATGAVFAAVAAATGWSPALAPLLCL